ncbi:MAG TPA: peptidylprolyl isomerase [Longimicrobiales bacterium]|nr:peptidylprolyl isomerase [Longimicrobiales bacterium]
MRKLTALILFLLTGCGDPEPPAILVGPVSFTEDQLLGLSPSRRLALAHLTAFGLAVSDSSTAELGAPLVSRWEDDRALEIFAAELTLQKNGITDDVLEARYLTDPDHELTVRHILFFSERWRTAGERAEAKAKAEKALELLRDGADFAQTASQLSEEPGAEGRQGLLTPGRKGAWVDEFWAAASGLAVGEMSAVTETQYGFHILRLEGREVVPFGEARSRIARDVADRIEDPRSVLAGWEDGRALDLALVEESLARAPALETGDALARWSDGALTFGDYLAWEASEPAAWNRGGMGSDPVAFRASVTALARRQMGLDEAGVRDVVVPPQERAELVRDWEDLAYRWTTALGFRRGSTPEAVAEAALEALADPAQSAGIARDELDQRAPLLAARYEMALTETDPSRQP